MSSSYQNQPFPLAFLLIILYNKHIMHLGGFFMEKLTIKDLYKDYKKYENKQVSLDGWVKTVRDSKTFGFIEMQRNLFYCQNLELGGIIIS